MTDTTSFSTDLLIKQVVIHFPDTLHVFRQYNIDTCCGGTISVAEAAGRHGVDLSALERDLRQIIPPISRRPVG